MTNLSEAMIEAGKQAYTDWQQGRYPATTTLPEAIFTAMQQAATPAAPVQDDCRKCHGERMVQENTGPKVPCSLCAPVPNDDPMVRDVEEWLRTHPLREGGFD